MNHMTATELKQRNEEYIAKCARLSRVFEPLTDHLLVKSLPSREVCARRARKLRKRGEMVLFSSRTANGKNRYKWSKKAPNFVFLTGDKDALSLSASDRRFFAKG